MIMKREYDFEGTWTTIPLVRDAPAGETSAVTSAVGDNHLPESLSGPCRCSRYHELNTHKLTKSCMHTHKRAPIAVLRPILS
jgi:hypothetical protein